MNKFSRALCIIELNLNTKSKHYRSTNEIVSLQSCIKDNKKEASKLGEASFLLLINLILYLIIFVV